MHTHTLQDGAILYQSKLTIRPDVAWNRNRNDIAQHILAGKPGGGTTGPRKTKLLASTLGFRWSSLCGCPLATGWAEPRERRPTWKGQGPEGRRRALERY